MLLSFKIKYKIHLYAILKRSMLQINVHIAIKRVWDPKLMNAKIDFNMYEHDKIMQLHSLNNAKIM